MAIRIIAVGKRHEEWVRDGIERYQKRLLKPFDVEWVLLPHSHREGAVARQDESERIMTRLGDAFVVLLDERGHNVDSPAFSCMLEKPLNESKPITIIIGGAYGVDESIYGRAQFVWSLSKLVFPHQLVRLILVEQLYRAQEISKGHPYHHE